MLDAYLAYAQALLVAGHTDLFKKMLDSLRNDPRFDGWQGAALARYLLAVYLAEVGDTGRARSELGTARMLLGKVARKHREGLRRAIAKLDKKLRPARNR